MIPYIALIFIILFIGLFVYAIVRGGKKHEAERRNFFKAFAERKGFQFRETDQYRLKEKVADLGAIGFAKNEIKNIVFSRERRAEIFLFDQVKVVTTGGSRGGYFTVCLLVAEGSFGIHCVVNEAESKLAASLSRRMAGARSGMSPVEFEDDDFDSRYIVFSERPDVAKQMFGPEIRGHLIGYAKKLPMPIVVQIKDNRLAVHNTGLSSKTVGKPNELETMFELAKGLKGLLLP